MNRFVLAGLLCGVFCLAPQVPASHAESPALETAAKRVARPNILVIAHRGDSKVAPENTLPAFASAVRAGADLVELDYFHSADEVPVVCHDKELDRTSNAVALWGQKKTPVSSKSLAELQELDAGSWFDPKFAGTRIPTLSQALDAIQAGAMTLIERKGGDPAVCLRLLKDKKLLDHVVVQAFDWDFLAACHRLEPSLVLGALGHDELTAAKLDQIAPTGATAVGWESKFVDQSGIDAIHARGWKAWVWTVDEPQRVAELVKMKVDGIITNRPAKTRAVVSATLSGK